MSLIAVLKTRDLKIVKECELPLEQFPDMVELEELKSTPATLTTVGLTGLPGQKRQFFRIGITEGRAVYREGFSYRVKE